MRGNKKGGGQSISGKTTAKLTFVWYSAQCGVLDYRKYTTTLFL